jgi:hypothetical protein
MTSSNMHALHQTVPSSSQTTKTIACAENAQKFCIINKQMPRALLRAQNNSERMQDIMG